ncbi:hypothetical protein EWM64_g7561 [Hericium alpestre]|uniref:Uncharacterized protein n=1 Tax=Hericium alpestre TaxID=135208 RepID=A0A4Y9ZQE1_9AGAM|nr:hypothetical protein EWM64_g7561 [Hericium alpestre]
MANEKTPLREPIQLKKKKLPFPYGLFPASLRPYAELMRLHRPSGTIMIFWPYAFGATMAAYQTGFPVKQYWAELGKFLIAAFFVRSAGCTINDIADREFDAGVAWLGLTMSMGIFIGWAAIAETPNWLLLGSFMLGFVAWTLHFDTIYACQDRKDDINVGVKSTAVILGDLVIPFAMMCSTTFVGALAFAGYLNGETNAYYFVTVAGTAAHFAWQLATIDLEDPDSCNLNFTRNGQLGWVLWGGMAVDYLLKMGVVQLGEGRLSIVV